MSAFTNVFKYGDKTKVEKFNKYKEELKELKGKGEVEDIFSVQREHIIAAIAELEVDIVNNLDKHSKITIYQNGNTHTYDKCELIFEVLDKLMRNDMAIKRTT